MIMFKLKQFRKVTSTIIKMQIYSGGFFFVFRVFLLVLFCTRMARAQATIKAPTFLSKLFKVVLHIININKIFAVR